MNACFKIFLSGLIIIVVAYFLIRRRKILEGFATKTASGKECIPWKNAWEKYVAGPNICFLVQKVLFWSKTFFCPKNLLSGQKKNFSRFP